MIYSTYTDCCLVTLLVVVCFHTTIADVCTTNFTRVIHPFTDNVTSDTPIYEYPNELDGLLRIENADCRKDLEINGTKVMIISNVLEDCNRKTFQCKVTCNLAIRQTLSLIREALPSGNISFNKDSYSVNVLENYSPPFLYDFADELNKTDCYPSNGKRLKIKSNDTGPFSIRDTFVVLSEGKQLDYEGRKNVYSVKIYYELAGRTAATTLYVHVKDVDDMDPVFNQSSYIYNVYENSVDTVWRTTTPAIDAYDRDFGDGRQNLSYSLIDASIIKDQFSINVSNGSIKVIKELDREKTLEYMFKIKVVQDNDHRRSATADLTIQVQDLNDNLPKFIGQPATVKIDEHSSHGTFVCAVSANDKDAPPYDNTTYRLVDYTDVFYVDVDQNDGAYIRVNNSDKLDRETMGDTISLQILAIDATNNTEGGNTTVEINIMDINDNIPTFDSTGYTFTVGNKLGIIGKVNATDKDSLQNGYGKVLYYILHSSNVPSINIDRISGEINLTQPIADDIEIYVEACDNPTQQSSRRCSQVLVQLKVNSTDIHDVVMYANVYENVQPGTIVTFINVTGSYYKVTGENSSFAVDTTSGIVTTSDNIDRENEYGLTEYIVNIHVMSKTQRVFANITLHIDILDVNDNSPVYNKLDYFFMLPEKILPGHFIGSVNATDKDTGDNSFIQYILPETIVSSYFTVNATSGDIYIANSNLPAAKELFQLIIVAKDKGTPSLESSCNVYVSTTIVEDTFVRISTPIEASVLESKKAEYEQNLSGVLLVDITIEKVNSSKHAARRKRSTHHYSIPKSRSFMYISATNKTGSPLPSGDLQKLVLQHMEGVQALFMTEDIPLPTSKDSSFTASQIALVVLAAVILVGGVLVVYVIFKTRTKQRAESISSMEDEKPNVEEDNISLQSMEMTMTLEEEREKTSDYEGSHNSNEQITPESDNVRGIINPVYQNSDETVLKLAEQYISTNEQAKEHLSELTKMLNKEDDQAPKPDYEIVDIVTEDTKRPDPAPDYIDVMHTTNQNTHPPKADCVNISNVDSNEVKYPQKADYTNITSSDSNEVKYPQKADYTNITSVDSNEVKYPQKADYTNITSVDSNEVKYPQKADYTNITSVDSNEVKYPQKADYTNITSVDSNEVKYPQKADYTNITSVDSNEVKYPQKADYTNITSVDSNEVKYPQKADYTNITSSDSNEVNNTKQDEYMPTKHEECAEGEDTGLVYVDTPHIDYENDGVIDQPSFISNREFDEDSGELIISSDEKRKASSSSPSNHGYANGTITADVNSDQTDDLLDEEPDVDYNDKQVRFASVVLDTEENKFEPIKSENSKTPSDGESLPPEIEHENNITDGESQLVHEMRNELTVGENGNVSDIPDEEITPF